MKILFVCSSNVCRSPYCEFVFGRLLEADEVLKGKVEVDSAAVLNHSERLHPKSRQALLNEGFTAEELDAFRPKHIREAGAAFEAADMIIGMTRWHKWLLKKEWKGKFETLSEAATRESISFSIYICHISSSQGFVRDSSRYLSWSARKRLPLAKSVSSVKRHSAS